MATVYESAPPPYEVAQGVATSTVTKKAAPLLVALFGKTGTGKTTFIKSVTGRDLKIGHSLESCTEEVEAIPYQIGEQEMFLIDTPGFDDTNLTDREVLQSIADWMGAQYKNTCRLSGIIYLHRISDPRMDGASMRNLRLFQSLCGENNLHNVILATTMWETTDDALGEAREAELVNKYWKTMIDKGSTPIRISNNPDDAKRLVRSFLNNQTMVLRIQEELQSGKTLDQTDAGVVLKAELEKMRKKYEKELANATKEIKLAYQKIENIELQRQINAEIDEVRGKLAEVEREKELLMNAVPAHLPKQRRRFLDGNWHCLYECGNMTNKSGRWKCRTCNTMQKNVR